MYVSFTHYLQQVEAAGKMIDEWKENIRQKFPNAVFVGDSVTIDISTHDDVDILKECMNNE